MRMRTIFNMRPTYAAARAVVKQVEKGGGGIEVADAKRYLWRVYKNHGRSGNRSTRRVRDAALRAIHFLCRAREELTTKFYTRPARPPAARMSVRLISVLTAVLLLLAAPLRLSAQQDTTRAGVWMGVGTALVSAALLDQAIRGELAAADPHQVNHLARAGNRLGDGRLVALTVGAVYGIGRLSGEEEISRFAAHTFAGVAAAGAANAVLKIGVGRMRPNPENRTDRFRPFNLDDGWQSFPSGHVVTAFALATAISDQAERPWVSGVSYGAAALVAWSRLHEDRHWTSDVVAGAVLGTAASRYTVGRLRRGADSEEGHPAEQLSRAGRMRDAASVSVTPIGITVSIPAL
ncbi:hypothetical protein BH23GEM3_BH23GEM3_23720 [soil metagenome]